MKTLAKSALCGLYKYSGLMAAQEAALRWSGRSFMTVLLFHRVTDDIPEDGLTVGLRRFRQLCRMLREHFRVVPLGEVFRIVRAGAPIPHRTVAITFDDCYRDNRTAAQVLAEYGLPACFFLPTAYVGTEHVFPWDRARGLEGLPNLSWDDVAAMVRLGFEFGSHTVTHPNLAAVSPDQARHELTESKAVIEERTGRKVRWFAYPFGEKYHFPPQYLAVVEEAGYEGCLSGYGGFIRAGQDGRMLPREPVPSFQSNLNLELRLRGCLEWYYGLKRRWWVNEETRGFLAELPYGPVGLEFSEKR
jgi:peptidoglycan/xylan/chitin deacetylase (PgdA/CDA1 family)